MSTITTRAGKGSPLTNTEVDANFQNLNNDKLESVSESDVTQHQAALSITESQISDLQSYITDYTVTEGDVTAHQAALSITESQISDLDKYTDSDVAAYLAANDYKTATNIVASITDSAPATLDTLNELAAALGDDPNFATTVTTSIGTKAAKTTTISAGTALTGGGDLSANRTISHSNVTRTNTTDTDTLSHSGTFTAITGLTSNAQGHVTGAETTTYTLPAGAVPNNATITVAAGTDLATGGDFTTDQGTDETITINHANISRTNTTSTASPAHGGTFTAIDGVTTSATGHITGVNTKTITLPADNNTWRPIHDTPVDGATTTSISSNWAFDNVKTPVPVNALFTDTVYSHPTHPGDDINLDTGALTGATVISDLDFNVTTDTLGHVTDANATYNTRTLTAADIGAQPAGNYVLRSGDTMTGALLMDGAIVKSTVNTVSASTAATTVDFTESNFHVINMSANTTFTFSNLASCVTSTGTLVIKQDATGGRTFTLPAVCKTPVGGAAIVQSTGANSTAIISYLVVSSTEVLVNYIGDFA
jgi:hypothetical protein